MNSKSREDKNKNKKRGSVADDEKELRIDISMIRLLAKKRPNEFKRVAEEVQRNNERN